MKTMQLGFVVGKDVNALKLQKLVKDNLGDIRDLTVKVVQLRHEAISVDTLEELIGKIMDYDNSSIEHDYYDKGRNEKDISAVLKKHKALLVSAGFPSFFIGEKRIIDGLKLLRMFAESDSPFPESGIDIDAIAGSPPRPRPPALRLPS